MVILAAFAAALISALLNAVPSGKIASPISFAISSNTPREAMGGNLSMDNLVRPVGVTKSRAKLPL